MLINARLPLPRKVLLRLRSILLVVMLTVLALPLGGLYFFRIYENELVQQTELELISQAAVLAATFRQTVRDQANGHDYGYVLFTGDLGKAYLSPAREVSPESQDYQPVTPRVDLIAPIELPRPEARPSIHATDTLAQNVGARMKRIMQDMQQGRRWTAVLM